MGRLLLVRHGQASLGADDYDVLSPTGHRQSAVLGHAFADRGVVPDVVVRGGMRRHRETAAACIAAAGWSAPEQVDRGWDEFDHVDMLAHLPAPFEGREPSRGEFQTWFEQATERWTGGEYDDYTESFDAFSARVGEALTRTVALAESGTVVVVSSGGPIAWCVASLLADSNSVRIPLWRRLNSVCANSGVTRVVSGQRGVTMVSFNEHTHLDGVPGLLTYR